MIDLHLVSWNRPKMTELVIKTIHRNTKRESFRLTVLDNGSDSETRAMLQNLYDNAYIDEYSNFEQNMGLEFARQNMFERSTYGDYFIDIDNDCLPTPVPVGGMDWVEQLIDLMDKYEDYAAVACRTQVMIGTGNIFTDESKEITEFPHPGGSLRIMRSSAVAGVGGWDRESSGRGSEERYICGKLREAGYKTGFATHIPTLHLFGDTTTDRWGYPIDYQPEATGHSDISHPALTNGDIKEELLRFAGEEDVNSYYKK